MCECGDASQSESVNIIVISISYTTHYTFTLNDYGKFMETHHYNDRRKEQIRTAKNINLLGLFNAL